MKAPRTRGSPPRSGFGRFRSLCLFTGLVHYTLWVYTLVAVGTGRHSGSGAGHRSLPLPFPLGVYAWSIGQVFATLGIFRPVARALTETAWDSFARTKAESESESQPRHGCGGKGRASGRIPPLDVPTLSVRDFYALGGDDADAARSALEFLEGTYGADWRERPLLLRGLMGDGGSNSDAGNSNNDSYNDNNNNNQDGGGPEDRQKPRRLLTPEGLLSMSSEDWTIPYFKDARNPGALTPDGTATVSEIVRAMVFEGSPHKIGSQKLVQKDPSLLEREVAPRAGFLEGLFGNHFSTDQLLMPSGAKKDAAGGRDKRSGKNRLSRFLSDLLPGTTTVPVFVAHTKPLPPVTEASGSAGSCPATDRGNHPGGQEESPQRPKKQATTTHTGLHCEPIANVAVQLWGARTWTLLDPSQTWNLRPAISNDGRSFFPSWIDIDTGGNASNNNDDDHDDLAEPTHKQLDTLPRYEVTTREGDALWLPTWTYHKVDYVYRDDDGGGSSGFHDDTGGGAPEPWAQRHHRLSIGASLFHFRPVDYLRRNPLFAVLLIPSLVRELAGTKTQ